MPEHDESASKTARVAKYGCLQPVEGRDETLQLE
jgi:hypothetical protein